MAGDADCGCAAEQQQPGRAAAASSEAAAGRRPPASPSPPSLNAAAANLSPCDVEALKRCLIEHDGDQRRCQAEVEAFKRACGVGAAQQQGKGGG